MTAFAEGAPCWMDAMLPDLAAGERFYGELLGWTFGAADPDHHGYTMAFHGGRAVAGLIAKPDGRMPTAWSVYLASPDAASTATRVKAAGGEVIAGPERVDPAGAVLVAVDPSGAVFGVWQAGDHAGFEETGAPGAFCWTELTTRDTEAVDPFYRAVFGYRTEQIGRPGGDFDYEVWTPPAAGSGPTGGRGGAVPVAGRLRMGADRPAGLPPHFTVLIGVDDCDAAVATVRALGGRADREPHDSPHGRIAAVVDDQGAHFQMIDRSRATGRPDDRP